MKTTLKIASILTWFNIIFWGMISAFAVLLSLGGGIPFLVIAIVVSAIPLNCYAALKLQASIRNPAQLLSSQTPTGIRFVGFVALFFGISCLFDGFAVIGSSKDALKLFNDQMAQLSKTMPVAPVKFVTETYFQVLGVLVILLGLFVVVNVVLNLRLLRWYYLVRKNDAGEKP